MTRLASIMGVAAVATLVLLSGCDTPTKTDYAKPLVGTWATTIDRQFPNPSPPPDALPGTTAVTAEVTRTGTNMGTVSLTIIDTFTGAPTPHLMITVNGSIEVTPDKVKVSDIKVEPQAALAQFPEIAAVLTAGLTLTYELSDDGSELTVEEMILFAALLGPTNTKVKLTKQMASNS